MQFSLLLEEMIIKRAARLRLFVYVWSGRNSEIITIFKVKTDKNQTEERVWRLITKLVLNQSECSFLYYSKKLYIKRAARPRLFVYVCSGRNNEIIVIFKV